MAQTAMAWGDISLYALPGGDHVWGREVQLLPSGTMAGAHGVIHGLVGVAATPIGHNQCKINASSPIVIYGLRGTDADQLKPFQDELAKAFNAQQAAREA
jgi:hypothetical protein